MTIKACDVCKQEVDKVVTLVDDLRTETINEVCESCRNEIDEVNLKIQLVLNSTRVSWLVKVIKKMRGD